MASFFSKRCEYGLQAVIYLASKENNALCSAKEISEELSIPKEFISKILQDLTEKGIIFSRKGRDGGFKLAVNANEIKLIDVVEAVDGLDIFN
ncbi:MAG TPA: Rrf2 family transcriptional regulator, partial [Ignavibacteriaceae bacterium]|nr:Rrf2 family transcriptional regulator [Ignavibacteriaceae bacterium]